MTEPENGADDGGGDGDDSAGGAVGRDENRGGDADAARGDGGRSSDAWSATNYDGNHSFVADYGSDVVDLLDPAADERILDLGCGTGTLTARLAETGADVVGLDRSRAMLDEAREKYPDLRFVRGDARALAVGDDGADSAAGVDGDDEAFDAVFSNAALHWVPDADHDDVLANVRDAVRPGGRFVAELGGVGNVGRIVSAVDAALRARGHDIDHPWYFPSVGEYAPRLEAHGFEVRYATLFDRPTELDDGERGLDNWLRMFGEQWFGSLPQATRDAVVADAEDALRGELFRDGTWTADYRRLRFVAVREE